MLCPFFLFRPGTIPIRIPVARTIIIITVVVGFVTPKRVGHDAPSTLMMWMMM